MKKTFLFLLVAVLCLTGRSLSATTIFTEDFESATAALSLTTAGHFTAINGTNIDVVSAATGWASLIVSPGAGNVVDLGGTGGNSFGNLQSTAILLAPGTYTLSFDLVGSQRGVETTTNVKLAPTVGSPLVSDSFTLGSSDKAGLDGLVTEVFVVTGSPEFAFLTFDLAAGADNIGSLLDNVNISTATPPVPEPGSLLLLGSGLTLLAGVIRRKMGARV